ncbi:MAG: hypothetical protein ACLP6E_02000 [Acidimicrobiales bacterium]
MNSDIPGRASRSIEATDGRSTEVTTVLEAVPEFLERYLELVELADDDPGTTETFCELAEFVAELAAGIEQFRPLLTRCLTAVEQVASTSEDAEELVGWSFLDYLSLDTRRAVLPWLGPSTLAVLEAIEDPVPT